MSVCSVVTLSRRVGRGCEEDQESCDEQKPLRGDQEREGEKCLRGEQERAARSTRRAVRKRHDDSGKCGCKEQKMPIYKNGWSAYEKIGKNHLPPSLLGEEKGRSKNSFLNMPNACSILWTQDRHSLLKAGTYSEKTADSSSGQGKKKHSEKNLRNTPIPRRGVRNLLTICDVLRFDTTVLLAILPHNVHKKLLVQWYWVFSSSPY